MLLTVNAVVGVLGSLGNLLVCLAIATDSRLRRSSNYLLFSLAVADLIVSLICEPIVLEFISQLTFFHKCRTSAEELVYHVLVSLSCQTSFFHLVSISIDRFVAVAFPLRHKIFMEKGGLKVMLVTSWSLSDSYFRFIQYHSDWFHSRLWSYRICNLFLQWFKYFLVSLFDCGSSAPPQEENKAANSSNSFCEIGYPLGSPCYLHTGYRNRRQHRLLGSYNNFVCH